MVNTEEFAVGDTLQNGSVLKILCPELNPQMKVTSRATFTYGLTCTNAL